MRILVSIIVLLSFFACKKEECMTCDVCSEIRPIEYINSELSGSKFKMGTYWVYIDSATSQIDTMKIVSIMNDGLLGNSRCDNWKHEYYAFKVDKSYNTSGGGDIYSYRGDGIMMNQTEELGNRYIYKVTSNKIDSLFIYDRYYKSVVKTTINGVTSYFNLSYGLLRIDNYYSKKLLKDKFIIR